MPKSIRERMTDFRESLLPESAFDFIFEIGIVSGMREERHTDIYDHINSIMEGNNEITQKS